MYDEDEYYDGWDDEDYDYNFCFDCGEPECCCDEIEKVGGFADRYKPEDEAVTIERLLRDLDINYNLPGQLDDIPF